MLPILTARAPVPTNELPLDPRVRRLALHAARKRDELFERELAAVIVEADRNRLIDAARD